MEREHVNNLKEALKHISEFGVTPKGSANLVDVGSGDYIKYFEKEVLDELVSKGGATCKFYEGTSGSGKTHIIELLREKALSKGMIVACTDLSKALTLSDWRQITEYILQNMTAVIDGQVVHTLPEILAVWGGKQSQEKLEVLKAQSLNCPGFKNAIVYATKRKDMDDITWEMLKQYLLGKRVSTALLKGKGLTGIRGNLNQRNAEYVLKTILSSLYTLGFNGTLLLFDENEKTLIRQTKRNTIAANLMRRLVDSCSSGMLVGTGVVFTLLSGFIENAAISYPALGQRLQIIKGGTGKASWRWPVLNIEHVNSFNENSQFVEQTALFYKNAINTMGGDDSGIMEEFDTVSQDILKKSIGMGFKKKLVKVYADIAMKRLDNVSVPEEQVRIEDNSEVVESLIMEEIMTSDIVNDSFEQFNSEDAEELAIPESNYIENVQTEKIEPNIMQEESIENEVNEDMQVENIGENEINAEQLDDVVNEAQEVSEVEPTISELMDAVDEIEIENTVSLEDEEIVDNTEDLLNNFEESQQVEEFEQQENIEEENSIKQPDNDDEQGGQEITDIENQIEKISENEEEKVQKENIFKVMAHNVQKLFKTPKKSEIKSDINVESEQISENDVESEQISENVEVVENELEIQAENSEEIVDEVEDEVEVVEEAKV